MRRFLFIINLLILIGCISTSKPNNSSRNAWTVIDNYSKKLEQEGIINRWYGVRCAGPDKIYDGKIHEISLGYSINKNLKYQDARRYFYKIVDNFLNEINSNEYIRNQFFNYPVTYKDLHFSLSFDYKSNGHLEKDDVDMISIQFNEIFYSIANIDGAIDKLVFNETHPGMGTVTHTGLDSTRKIIRKLPETEKDASTIP